MLNLLKVIRKEEPIFGKKSKWRFVFSDNFFRFWYEFIFPNRSVIELGNLDLAKKKIERSLNQYTCRRFESIVMELLILYNSKKIKNLELNFEEIGSWWGKNRDGETENIDIIAHSKTKNEIIVGEVKWTNKQAGLDIVNKLMKRAELLDFKGRVRYLIVSKNGFEEKCIRYMDDKDFTYLTLNDIKELMDEYKE